MLTANGFRNFKLILIGVLEVLTIVKNIAVTEARQPRIESHDFWLLIRGGPSSVPSYIIFKFHDHFEISQSPRHCYEKSRAQLLFNVLDKNWWKKGYRSFVSILKFRKEVQLRRRGNRWLKATAPGFRFVVVSVPYLKYFSLSRPFSNFSITTTLS